MVTKRKADCTPQEWARILELGRKNRKAQNTTPEQQERRRAYARAYSKSERGRAKDKARYNERRKDQIRARAQFKKYGITAEQFAALLIVQGFRCAVCEAPFVLQGKERRFVHVDHCHSTHRVRGLLCARCNVTEGYIRSLGLTPTGYAKRLEHYLANPPSQEEQLW